MCNNLRATSRLRNGEDRSGEGGRGGNREGDRRREAGSQQRSRFVVKKQVRSEDVGRSKRKPTNVPEKIDVAETQQSERRTDLGSFSLNVTVVRLK